MACIVALSTGAELVRKVFLEDLFDQLPSLNFTVNNLMPEFPPFTVGRAGTGHQRWLSFYFFGRVSEERLVNPKQTLLPFSNIAKQRRTDLNFLCFDGLFKIRNETNGRTIKTFINFA